MANISSTKSTNQTTADKATTSAEKKQQSWVKIAAVIGIGFIIILFAFKVFAPNNVSISGSIKYNGLKPEDATQGKVVILQKEIGEKEYETAVDNVKLKDNVSWEWTGAEEGKTYQLVAYIDYKGQRIADSSTLTVTAPTSNQVLTFNVTSEDLPNTEVSGVVTISGELDLNGYIPTGSYVNIYAKEKDQDAFEPLSQGIPAEDGRKLSWSAAKAGVYYTFQGELYDANGTFIGESNDITIVGPASGQVMRIDSQAKAPAETVSISGIVNLNGPTQPNSTILLLQRKPGDKNYTAFDRIPAVSGSKWSWDKAKSGQQYEISASLQVNEKDTSVGNVLNVTAPATDEVITINTNFSLTPPTQAPTFSCGNQQEGRWNVTLTFQSIANAAQYYLQAGINQGSGDLLGERVSATGGNVTRNILVNDGQTNYARYAYTFDTSCSSQQCFSGSSPTLIFKCPN